MSIKFWLLTKSSLATKRQEKGLSFLFTKRSEGCIPRLLLPKKLEMCATNNKNFLLK